MRRTILVLAVLSCACASRDRAPIPALQGRAACAGDVCAPEPEGVRSGRILFDYWLDQSDRVNSHLGDISNRSKVFGDLRDHYLSLFKEMELAQREGVERLEQGDREGAWARLNALWIALPVVTLQLEYVILASHAEDGTMVTTHWMAMLGDMSRRTAPLLEAALQGFDRRRMEAAAKAHQTDLLALEENLPRIQAALAKGGRWVRNGVAIANGVTLALAAYDAARIINRGTIPGREFTVRVPTFSGRSGAVASVAVIPAAVLDSLRELLRIGALSAATLSVGTALMVGKPEVVGAPPQRGIGGSGWRGDTQWKTAVRQVDQGGTIRSINKTVPTEAEAMDLIKEGGGRWVRTEAPHQPPNPHGFWHINYITSNGGKGTIEIVPPVR